MVRIVTPVTVIINVGMMCAYPYIHIAVDIYIGIAVYVGILVHICSFVVNISAIPVYIFILNIGFPRSMIVLGALLAVHPGVLARPRRFIEFMSIGPTGRLPGSTID